MDTSPSKRYLDSPQRGAVESPGAHSLWCPKYRGPVLLSVCQECPSHGGYLDTGNAGREDEARYRVKCTFPAPRLVNFVRVGPEWKNQAGMVHCPLHDFALRGAEKCFDCNLFHGTVKLPLNFWQRVLRMGALAIACAHPIGRRFSRRSQG